MAKREQRQSENVFEQLGFKPEEALNLRLRSDMMDALIAGNRKETSHPGAGRQAARRLATADLGPYTGQAAPVFD